MQSIALEQEADPSPTGVQRGGFMAGPVLGAIPSFVCRFVPAGLRELRVYSALQAGTCLQA